MYISSLNYCKQLCFHCSFASESEVNESKQCIQLTSTFGLKELLNKAQKVKSKSFCKLCRSIRILHHHSHLFLLSDNSISST